MFGSLNDEIGRSSGRRWSSGASLLRYAGVLAATVVAFGALYMGLHFLE